MTREKAIERAEWDMEYSEMQANEAAEELHSLVKRLADRATEAAERLSDVNLPLFTSSLSDACNLANRAHDVVDAVAKFESAVVRRGAAGRTLKMLRELE
jgi:hypothetical protein